MPRIPACMLSAVLVLCAFISLSIAAPRVARASSATTTADVELRVDPRPDAAVVGIVPAAAVVSIDGPLQGGFYPISYNGTSGWAAGTVLDITKDSLAPPPGTPADPAGAPVPSTEKELAALSPPPVSDPVLATPTTSDASVTTEAAASTVTPPEPASAATPVPVDSLDPVLAASTAPALPPAREGPAQATADVNLRAGPSAADDVVFLIPAGSTVTRTGAARNGFVEVTYQGMAGWVAADYLSEPPVPASEPAPVTTPEDEEVRTARPGSGVAFTTAELPLRAGPSAAEPAVALVPAGSRLILTGVAEGEYQRVEYREALGWVDAAYLSMPEDPAPETERGRGGGQERRTYTREEIIKIIYAAADRYDQSRSAMLRVAECESGLDPYAVNPSGSYGLFQFIRSTWESTPYADEDIFDPRANANAAGWMWSVGRRNEWVCR